MDFKMILTDFGKVPDFEKQVCIGLVIYCTEVSSGGPDTGGQRADAGSDSWKKNDLGKWEGPWFYHGSIVGDWVTLKEKKDDDVKMSS